MTPLACLVGIVAWAVISAVGAAWIFRPSQREPKPTPLVIMQDDPDTFSPVGWWLAPGDGTENPLKKARFEDE